LACEAANYATLAPKQFLFNFRCFGKRVSNKYWLNRPQQIAENFLMSFNFKLFLRCLTKRQIIKRLARGYDQKKRKDFSGNTPCHILQMPISMSNYLSKRTLPLAWLSTRSDYFSINEGVAQPNH